MAAAARDAQPLLPLPRLLPLPSPTVPLPAPLRYDMSSGEMHPPFPLPPRPPPPPLPPVSHLPRPSFLSPLNCLSVNILPAHFLHSYVEARQKHLKWKKKKKDLLVFCALSLCAEQGQMFVMVVGGGVTKRRSSRC